MRNKPANNTNITSINVDLSKDPVTLIDQEAENLARQLIPKPHQKGKLTKTQIRKYYNEIKTIDQWIKYSRQNQEERERFYQDKAILRVKMLRSRVTYDANRETNKISAAFEHFISTAIKQCKDYKTFEKFTLLFEAVIGFCYKDLPKS